MLSLRRNTKESPRQRQPTHGTYLITPISTPSYLHYTQQHPSTPQNPILTLNQVYTPEGSSPSTYYTTATTTTTPAHTFYSVHIMSYCQGTLGPLPPGATDLYGTRNVTDCSNRTVLFAFDPTAAWPKEITHGPALEWPRVISDDFHAFRMTSRAMAVSYIIGVGTMGTVLLVKGVEVATRKKQYGVFEFGFLVVCQSQLDVFLF